MESSVKDGKQTWRIDKDKRLFVMRSCKREGGGKMSFLKPTKLAMVKPPRWLLEWVDGESSIVINAN